MASASSPHVEHAEGFRENIVLIASRSEGHGGKVTLAPTNLEFASKNVKFPQLLTGVILQMGESEGILSVRPRISE
jgi:hypothetical protein